MGVPLPKRRRRDISWAVVGLTAVFTAIFLLDVFTPLALASRLALQPREVVMSLEVLQTDPASLSAWAGVLTVFTHVFVHSGVAHLGFNMLYFWFFGSLLAQVAGDRWVLGAMLLCSITSAAAFVVAHADGAPTGVLGASGAISGVAGLYVLLAFRWQVPDARAWPLARPIPPMQAALLAIVATALDLYVVHQGGRDGVARESHLGGFGGGLLLGMLLTTVFPTWAAYRASRWSPQRFGGEGS